MNEAVKILAPGLSNGTPNSNSSLNIMSDMFASNAVRLHPTGPRTEKRYLPQSVLVIISKQKKENQISTETGYLSTLLSPLRSGNYFEFGLKGTVRSRERYLKQYSVL